MIESAQTEFVERFAADVEYYLMQEQRQLPSRYLYDEVGSALFEAICRLPWYSITRAEGRLLAGHAREIIRRVQPSVVVELGSGSGEKLKALLDGAPTGFLPARVDLVDLSAAALAQSIRTLEPFREIQITAHQEAYEEGMGLAAGRFTPADRALVLFLGSNVGNFDPPACAAFLGGIRRQLRPGDSLLIGADLVKPREILELAYDDPVGVTAAFNRNLLARVNRELGGNFAIGRFAHRAIWNEPESRVEMHMVATSVESIRIELPELEMTMAEGESIWTESSYKFRAAGIGRLLDESGFRQAAQWIDHRDQFALTLAEAV